MCGGKESLVLKGRRMQTSHTGKVRFFVITRFPKPVPKVALTPGFKAIAACLLRDSPLPAPIETSPEIRQPDMLMGPTVTMMYATHIVQDRATGVIYMGMVTASVGRVALRNPHMMATLPAPTVEDITNLP